MIPPRTVRIGARAGSVLLTLTLAALTSGGVGAASVASTAEPVAAAYSLQSLGVPSQTVFGGSSTVAVLFPPPPGPLAGPGLLDVVVSHGLLAPGSGLALWLNRHPLQVLPLQGSGVSTASVPVPLPAIADGQNLLEARFQLFPQGSAPAEASLEDESVFEYQLTGQPGLGTYPFPVVRAQPAIPAQVGLVLPSRPDRAEVTAALLLADDLGRRSAPQAVAPEVVEDGQLQWLEAGGTAALLVGTWSQLPTFGSLLEAAGFRPVGGGWQAPDGRPVGGQGVLAETTSPWDHQSPLLLVTGADDGAVMGAAVALASGIAQLPGVFALVPPQLGPIASSLGPDPGGTVSFPLPTAGVELSGAHAIQLTLPFQVPAVQPTAGAELEVLAAAPPGTRLEALVDGHGVAEARLPSGRRLIRFTVPASLLVPGQDALTLVAAVPAGPVLPSLQLFGASLRLPEAPTGVLDLHQLPDPLLDDPGGLGIVLPARTAPLLTAAARAMAGLGARSPALPALAVVYPNEVGPGTLEDRSLLVVGTTHEMRRLAPQLGLQVSAAVPGAGVVEEVAGGGHAVLWVGGDDARSLLLASEALQAPLSGTAVTVSGVGQATPLAGSAPSEPPQVAAVRLLIVLTAMLLVAGVCWQVLRPRPEAV